MRPKLKICGMRFPANIEEVVLLKPDYLGFIFYEQSKRYIADLSPQFLTSLQGVNKVGVFVNDSIDRIKSAVDSYGLQAIQLHGDESPAFIESLKELEVSLIKAFGVSKCFDWSRLDAYDALVDYFLFDTKSENYGGTGKGFDWSLLENYTLDKPFFLSGGLSPDNVEEALSLADHRLYAIDVNSRFEKSPGLKDLSLLQSVFCR
ncbi:phosphoribosylanthranilate isomerase [Olivibacter sp. XZL3]|uniref:phosphoribosylanthranilate isomerase n=1 Tax=Olivibacter sp. XZL3 TaxID=1735116 RepID=UPI0010660C58|nr:phosphoribosylanthranilate isomerase [Olivibacter sp. XZL3]